MKKLFSFLLLVLMILPLSAQGQLVINEFMASNGTVISDGDGEYDDWIELYNAGAETIDLSGYFLSDDINQPAKWAFPENSFIEAGQYLIIWADNENSGLHTSFSISRQEEEIALSDPDTVLIDSIRFYDQIYDYSFGRDPGSSEIWGYYANPTPGEKNSDSFVNGRCQAPVLLTSPGISDPPVRIELGNIDPEAEIYYTVDGSVPTENSKSYSSYIQLFQTAPVRVRAFKEGWLPSRVVTGTYFVLEEPRDIDIVSVSTDPYNLWDDEYGIHVVGTNGIEAYGIVANYNQEWERPVSVELFTPNGKREFQVDAGVKISGQYSRKNEHKSLAFYLRSEYGYSKLNYPLFPDKDVQEYNNFLLRNSGSEWVETMFGDAISQYIVKDQMDTDYMAYRPAAVYLNGEYWGILNLREKINEHYPASNYGIPAEEVDMLESSGDYDFRIVSGSNSDYMALRSFFESNDMSIASNYEHARSKIEIDHYTDYQITEIYENNTDWPGNNIKYWRHRTDPDSKWRWVMYDVDRGFSIRGQAPDYEKKGEDNLVRAMNSGKYNFILPGLIANPEYKKYFIQRFNAHIYTTFHPDRVKPIFDQWVEKLEGEMAHHLDRWGDNRSDWGPFDEKTVDGWKDIVGYKKYWAKERPAVMMGILKEYFQLNDTFRIDLAVSSLSEGKIEINGVESPMKSFSGVYFNDYPLELKALPQPGYHFDHWEGISFGNHNPEYALSLDENMSITAIFGKNQLQINEIMADNKKTIMDNHGEYDDWIELYNSGNSSINIGGMYISDAEDDPTRWQIPVTFPDSTTIQPGEYLLLWADGDTTQGILHLGFRLDDRGEVVTLLSSDKSIIISQMGFESQNLEKSFGDYPDGSLSRKYMPATPGSANIEFESDYQLYINEFMASNDGYIMDEFNEFDDWFEIYNAGTEEVDLAGFYLTDDFSNPVKYQLPYNSPELTTIPSQGFKLIWADDDDEQGALHTNFKLSAAGEQIAITEPGGKFFIDSLIYSTLQTDIAYGRTADGAMSWKEFVRATPEKSNLSTGNAISEIQDVIVYPNPVKDELTIDPGQNYTVSSIQLIDMHGRTLIIRNNSGSSTYHMDLSGFTPGMYVVRIVANEKVITKSILKE